MELHAGHRAIHDRISACERSPRSGQPARTSVRGAASARTPEFDPHPTGDQRAAQDDVEPAAQDARSASGRSDPARAVIERDGATGARSRPRRRANRRPVRSAQSSLLDTRPRAKTAITPRTRGNDGTATATLGCRLGSANGAPRPATATRIAPVRIPGAEPEVQLGAAIETPPAHRARPSPNPPRTYAPWVGKDGLRPVRTRPRARGRSRRGGRCGG